MALTSLLNFYICLIDRNLSYLCKSIICQYFLIFHSELLIQIEGAFIQGLGWLALEELKWGDAAHKWIPPGCLYTCGPGSYKIPSLNDVPLKFNVSLLKVYLQPTAYILKCTHMHTNYDLLHNIFILMCSHDHHHLKYIVRLKSGCIW